MKPVRLALLVLPCAVSTFVRADVSEDFSGHAPGASFTTGITLGDAGQGWAGGWRTNSSHVNVVARVNADRPIHEGPCLDVDLSGDAGQANKSSGAVARPYKRPQVPYTVEFRFRPATPDTGVRYFLFDGNTRLAGPSGTASWQIQSSGGFWQLLDGEGDGMPAATVATTMPVVPGITYAFAIDIDPVAQRWSVSISDGKRAEAHKNLRFRTNDFTPERWLHFGANESVASGQGANIGLSIDTLLIRP